MNQVNDEVWKPVEIDWVNGLYQVSNIGRIKSLDRIRWDGKGYSRWPGKILAQSITTTGYFKVELANKGQKKATKFIG